VGYLPWDPCGPAAGVGGTGFFDEFPANAGPYVVPGTYTVALTADGRTLDSKPMKVIMDPAVRLTDAQRKRYDAILMELHEVQRLGIRAANALNALYPQVTAAAAKLKEAGNVPATVQAQFDALTSAFDAVRVKFGVPIVAGRGGGGGGGAVGRGGAAPENILARTAALKVRILGIWDPPSDGIVRQSTAERLALQGAVNDANALFTRAAAMNQSLKTYDITLTVPEAIR
jgi:hypothetical protein